MAHWTLITTPEIAQHAQGGYANRRVATKPYAWLCTLEGDDRPFDSTDTARVFEAFGVDAAGSNWWSPQINYATFDALTQDSVGVDSGDTPTEPPPDPEVTEPTWLMHDVTADAYYNSVTSQWGPENEATFYTHAQRLAMGDESWPPPANEGDVIQWVEYVAPPAA